MTALRSLTASLDATVDDALGDEITYTPAGGAAVTFNAWVNFASDTVYGGGSASTAPAKSVEVPMSVIAEPDREDRIAITIRPGKTFAPAKVEEDVTGAKWIITLKGATGG